MNTARQYTLDAAPGHPPVYTSLALLFADDLRCGFGAQRLTHRGSSRLRVEQPQAFPLFATDPPPRQARGIS
jgi:hypothetical protein